MWNGGSGNLERIGIQFPSNITADDSANIRVPLHKNLYFDKGGNSSLEDFVYLCGDETLAQHEIQKVVEFLPNLRHPQGMGDKESWHRLYKRNTVGDNAWSALNTGPATYWKDANDSFEYWHGRS
jgi:hypothetical protein